jgi:effector-binding domain-containing protein/ribosome-associated toxin RatA of RatAB toxin-antitoxin module
VKTATKNFIYVLGAIFIAVVVVGVFLPSEGQVHRESIIDAPPGTVFAVLNDLRRVEDWSPWIEADPQARIDVSRPASGVGAQMHWQGRRLGQGGQTIVESESNRLVAAQLDLGEGRPLRSTFEITGADAGTRVHWTCDWRFGINLLARYKGLFLESGTGREIERGLENIRTLVESLPRADWTDIEIERLEVAPQPIVYITETSAPNAAAISEAMGEAYFRILRFIDQHGLQEAGAPLSISRRFSGSEFVFDAAIPVRGVSDETPRSANGIQLGVTYDGPAIRGRHIGSYRDLSRTHEKMAAYLAAHGIPRAGDAWESYVSDPTRTPEPQLVTDIFYPVSISD